MDRESGDSEGIIDDEDDFSDGLILLEELMSRFGLGDREDSVDDGMESAVLKLRHNVVLESAGDGDFFLQGAAAEDRPDDPKALSKEPAERNLGVGSAEQADDDETTLFFEQVKVSRKVISPDRIEDDIDALVAGEVIDGAGKVEEFAVNGEVDAEFVQELKFGAACGSDDGRVEGLAELHGGGADPGGGGVNQDRFTRLVLGFQKDVQKGSVEDFRNGCSFGQGERGRDGKEKGGRGGDELGVAPAGEENGGSISRCPVLNALSDGVNHPGGLEAQKWARTSGRRVEPSSLKEVGAVAGRGVDFQANFFGTGERCGGFLPEKRTFFGINMNGFHRKSPVVRAEKLVSVERAVEGVIATAEVVNKD